MDITYQIEIEPEDIPVRGNAMASDDPMLDREVEDSIIGRIERGDNWAWCVIKVTASYGDGNWEGVDYLGACSYAGEEDFKRGGYWDDMRERAKIDLIRNLRAAITEGSEATLALAAIGGGLA